MEKTLESVKEIIIEGGKTGVFLAALREFYPFDIDEEDERDIHLELMELMAEYKRDELLKTFVKSLEDDNGPQESIFPTKTYLLTLPMSNETVKYYAKVIDPVFYEAMEGLINVLDEDQLWCAVSRIEDIFGSKILADDVKTLQKKLVEGEKRNDILEEYIDELLLRVSSEYAPVPDWIIPVEDLKTHDELVASIRSVKKN